MNTSDYELSDLNDFKFSWVKTELEVDALFEPGTFKLFLPTALNILERRESVEKPNLLDEEEDKRNSPLKTPFYGRPNYFPALLQNRQFATKLESALDVSKGNL